MRRALLVSVALVAGSLLGPLGATASASSSPVYVNESSANWAGFVAGANSQRRYSEMLVSLDITQPRCGAAENSISAHWIGVGGADANSSLPQLGIYIGCEKGAPFYGAWYEWFDPKLGNPNIALDGTKGNPHVVFGAGENVVLDMFRTDDDPTVWHGNINVTPASGNGGQGYFFDIRRIPGSTTPVGNTAECVTERPGKAGGGAYPLTNFGTMRFHQCQAGDSPRAGDDVPASDDVFFTANLNQAHWTEADLTTNQVQVQAGSFTVKRETLNDGKTPLASEGPADEEIDSDNGGFQVIWHAGQAPHAQTTPISPTCRLGIGLLTLLRHRSGCST